MNDLLEQMQQIKQMGSLSQVISMFPGAGKISEEETAAGEAQLKKTEAIINSMTKREPGKTGNHQSVPEASDRSRKRYQGGRCKPSAQAV